jgi:phosphoglycerate dehydrogenase-like enzyme
VLTGVLHFVKEVPSLQQRQRDHVWQRYAAGSLAGRRALVVGLGSIGRRVVETLSGLGVEVWGAGRPGGCYDIPGLTRTGSTDDLGSLLPECTIVVLCVPLTASTNGLIGAAELAAMPEDTVLVNIARGDVVVEDALVERLRTGRLRGAALDVARTEPLPADSPLWDLDTVLISPHSASTMVTENATLTELFIDNLGRYLRGEPLRNRYRADAGY